MNATDLGKVILNNASLFSISTETGNSLEQAIRDLEEARRKYLHKSVLLETIQQVSASRDPSHKQICQTLKDAVVSAHIVNSLDATRGTSKAGAPAVLGLSVEDAKEFGTQLSEVDKDEVRRLCEDKMKDQLMYIMKANNVEVAAGNCDFSKLSELACTRREEMCTDAKIVQMRCQNILELKMCRDTMARRNEILEELINMRLDFVAEVCKINTDWVNLKCNLLLCKIRKCELQLQNETYSKDGVDAMKILWKEMNQQSKAIKHECSKIRHQLEVYEKLYDEGFGDLLQECVKIQREINATKYTMDSYCHNNTC